MNFKNTGAVWLWDTHNDGVNQYVAFRQTITFTTAEKARLYISCDTNYELFINGKFVNFGQYLAMPENKFFDTLDVSEYVHSGDNTVCVLVYYQGVDTSCYVHGKPGLIFFTECDGKVYPNDGVVTAHASGFREGVLPSISDQLGPSFEYDARKEADWTSPDFEENDEWKPAVVLDFCDELPENIAKRPVEKLVFYERADYVVSHRGEFAYTAEQEKMNTAERMQQAMMRMSAPSYKPKNAEIVIDKDCTSVIIDLGCETAGCFEIDMTAGCEARIDVAYGEHIADLRVRSFVGNRNFAFTYYAKVGENRFVNFMRRLAGRYIQLNFSGVTEKCVIRYVGLRKTDYPVKLKKKINIPDKLHEKIYETSIKTLRECMHEHYEDCPWREQSLYAFDSKNQMLAGYTVFDNAKYAKACLELLDSTLGDDGYQSICSPHTPSLKIPGFSVMWIAAVCEYAEKTGRYADVRHLAENAGHMLDKYFEHCDENGTVLLPEGSLYWFFYDWADGLSGTIKLSGDMPDEPKADAVFCLEILYALEKYIRLCDGLSIDAKRFKAYYKSLKNAVNTVFYNPQKKLYRTFVGKEHYCVLAQSLAVIAGVAPNKKALLRSVAYDKSLVQTTLSTMAIKYEALMTADEYEKVVLDEIADIWGGMLFGGATTFYETADGESAFGSAGSLCHGWSAIPLIVYDKCFGKA